MAAELGEADFLAELRESFHSAEVESGSRAFCRGRGKEHFDFSSKKQKFCSFSE